jgi:hypothetical protein
MGALIVLTAAVAAQAAANPGTTPTSPPSDTAAPARKAGSTTYVDLEGGAGYSTNPELELNGKGSGYGRISLRAVHSAVSERTTTVLSAYAENITYTNQYGSNQALSIFARHESAVSEKLRVFGDLAADYQQGGQLDTRVLVLPNIPPLVGQPGGVVFLPGGADFLSVTGREYHFAGHVGAEMSLSARDEFTIRSGLERTIFHSQIADTNYTTVPVNFAYDRQLSVRTTVGARVVLQDTEYNGPARFRTITPQLTGRVQLSPTLNLSGAVGVTHASVDNGVTTHNSTGISANAALCSATQYGSLCGQFIVDQQTATTAGPSKVISGGVNYSRQLGANSTLSFSVSVDHYSQPVSVITGHSFSSTTYYHAAAEYSRSIGHRMFGGVNLAARKEAMRGPDPETGFNASLFIRYRFGDVQ